MKVAVLAAALAVAVAVTGVASSTPTASLRLLDTSPLTVKAAAFAPRERVAVTVRTEGTMFRAAARATRDGSFIVRFVDVEFRCGFGGSVHAVGAAGSRSALKLPQLLCPPPLRP